MFKLFNKKEIKSNTNHIFTKSYFEKRIDGYTGDCLGALEQIAEIVILLSIIVINKFLA